MKLGNKKLSAKLERELDYWLSKAKEGKLSNNHMARLERLCAMTVFGKEVMPVLTIVK